MTPRLVVVLLGAVVAGCASLSDEIATRPPQGRAAASVAQDEAECTAYGKAQPKHQGDYYQACMMARGYATNVNMDNLRWVVGVEQTRPHDVATVIADMTFCDTRADNAKDSDVVQLTPEQEASIANRAKTIAIKAGLEWAFGNLYLLNRPNAKRMLAACLDERGYAIVSYIKLSAPR
jgi:hypothetical protein